jgi:hypothetical protein
MPTQTIPFLSGDPVEADLPEQLTLDESVATVRLGGIPHEVVFNSDAEFDIRNAESTTSLRQVMTPTGVRATW